MEAILPEKRIYLSKADRITLCENNLVDLITSDGKVLKGLEPRRLFPVTKSEEYITLLDSDGEEVAIIRSLRDLDADSAQIIRNSLDDYYLVPKIVKIYSIADKNGKVHWEVLTDRGYKEFDIKNRNSDVKVGKDGRVRVRDSDDNRYTIDDYKTLDKHSRRQLIADL